MINPFGWPSIVMELRTGDKLMLGDLQILYVFGCSKDDVVGRDPNGLKKVISKANIASWLENIETFHIIAGERK
jgi:hypothetical protein